MEERKETREKEAHLSYALCPPLKQMRKQATSKRPALTIVSRGTIILNLSWILFETVEVGHQTLTPNSHRNQVRLGESNTWQGWSN